MIEFLTDAAINGALSWIGLIIGVIGLAATYREARAARSAAEKANIAVNQFRDKNNLSTLAVSGYQLDLVRNFIQSKNFQPAQTIFHPLKRSLLEYCAQLSDRSALEQQIVDFKVNIKLIETQIDVGIRTPEKHKADKTIDALSCVSDFLSERESEIKNQPVRG